jgi:hypothetical protein
MTKPAASPNAYRIIEAGLGYKVVRVYPDRAEPEVLAAFVTLAGAMEWLHQLLGVTGAVVKPE